MTGFIFLCFFSQSQTQNIFWKAYPRQKGISGKKFSHKTYFIHIWINAAKKFPKSLLMFLNEFAPAMITPLLHLLLLS